MAMSDNIIQVTGLKKYYNHGAIKALDGVSAGIRRGEVVVVIGPSGSGKSTFLRSLNLLEEPTSGSIIFEGVDITRKNHKDPQTGKMVKVNIDKHRQKMGMVFQQFNLFPHMTIMRNLTIGPMKLQGRSQSEAEAEARKLLERTEMKHQAIAQAVGYASVYYFSLQFKKQTGETPGQYRKRVGKKDDSDD